MWSIVVLLVIVATSTVHSQKEDEDVVFLVRLPTQDAFETTADLYYPKDVYTKRAIPFNGGMYGKRAAIPFSGGMYGKRSGQIFAQRRAAIPFSGGMYGKRSTYSSYADNENQIKRGAMPFSGGMYGR